MAIVARYDFGYAKVEIDDTYCKGITKEESHRRFNEFGEACQNELFRMYMEKLDKEEKAQSAQKANERK